MIRGDEYAKLVEDLLGVKPLAAVGDRAKRNPHREEEELSEHAQSMLYFTRRGKKHQEAEVAVTSVLAALSIFTHGMLQVTNPQFQRYEEHVQILKNKSVSSRDPDPVSKLPPPPPRYVKKPDPRMHEGSQYAFMRCAMETGRKLAGASAVNAKHVHGGGRGALSMCCGDPLCVNAKHVHFSAFLNTGGWNGELRCSPADMDAKQKAFLGWAKFADKQVSRRMDGVARLLLNPNWPVDYRDADGFGYACDSLERIVTRGFHLPGGEVERVTTRATVVSVLKLWREVAAKEGRARYWQSWRETVVAQRAKREIVSLKLAIDRDRRDGWEEKEFLKLKDMKCDGACENESTQPPSSNASTTPRLTFTPRVQA